MDASPVPLRSASSRSGRLRLNIAALVGSRGLTVALGLAQVAVALPYLGENLYGAWMLLLAIAGAAHTCDFGIGIGAQRAMAEALGQNDGTRARGIAREGAVLLSWVAVAGVVISLPVLLFTAWPTWSGLTTIAADVRPAALALLFLTALALPLNMVPRLAGAAQLQWVQALWSAAGSAATLMWVVFAALAHWSFGVLVGGAAVIALLQNIAMAGHTLRRLKWSPARWEALPRHAARELRRACGYYAVPQFGLALVQAMPSTVLSIAGGPVAVTAFNLVQRLLTPLTQAQGLMLATLWPAYTEAQARGDTRWVKHKFSQTLWITVGLLAAMAAVTSQADWLIALWTRRTVTDLAPLLAWLSFGWLATLALAQPLSTLLIGLGQQRALARSAALGYPAATIGLLVGGYGWGPLAALAFGISGLIFFLLPTLVLECHRTIPSTTAELP